MLLRGVHIPEIYRQIPHNQEYQADYCGNLLAMLRDMLMNCVLLVDENQDIEKEMTAGLAAWPPQYRKDIQEVLRHLSKKQRIYKVHGQYPTLTSCEHYGCMLALAIASKERPDFVIRPRTCEFCSSIPPGDMKSIVVNDYQFSSIAKQRRDVERIELADGQWNRREFEQRILEPLFRYTKRVALFDRHIGSSMFDRKNASAASHINQDYAACVQWIYETFARIVGDRPLASFEVTCGLKSVESIGQKKCTEIARTLHSFAAQLQTIHGIPLIINLKNETGNQYMRHARFLFTDQIGLQIDRGFNLLKLDGRIRDIIITIVKVPGTISGEARALPDIES